MIKKTLFGQAASYAAARYLEKRKPSKAPFIIAGLVCTLLVTVAVFAIRAERRVSTSDLSATPAKTGMFAQSKSEEVILERAFRREQDGAIIPAGSNVTSDGGIATDIRLQDVDGDGTKDLVVIGPSAAAGAATVTGYVWNEALFVYDANLTWALSTSRNLFPEP